jgi:hypothetical protein
MAKRHRNRSSFLRIKSVFVHDYPRWRFGRWEHVRQHFRSLPFQYSLDL